MATEVFELESETAMPPDPAAEDRVTKPDATWPPTTEVGLAEIPVRYGGGGFTVKPNPSVTFRYEAVTFTEVGVVTVSGATANVPELEPAGIKRDVGIVTSAGDAAIDTVAPPLGAAADSWAVHDEVAGGVNETGAQVSPSSAAG